MGNFLWSFIDTPTEEEASWQSDLNAEEAGIWERMQHIYTKEQLDCLKKLKQDYKPKQKLAKGWGFPPNKEEWEICNFMEETVRDQLVDIFYFINEHAVDFEWYGLELYRYTFTYNHILVSFEQLNHVCYTNGMSNHICLKYYPQQAERVREDVALLTQAFGFLSAKET